MVALTDNFYIPLDISSLDVYTTQGELADFLELHRHTIIRYNRQLRILLQEYREDSEDGMPLSRYQCWCIAQMQRTYKLMKKKTLVAKYIKNNEHLFSKYTFRRSYK